MQAAPVNAHHGQRRLTYSQAAEQLRGFERLSEHGHHRGGALAQRGDQATPTEWGPQHESRGDEHDDQPEEEVCARWELDEVDTVSSDEEPYNDDGPEVDNEAGGGVQRDRGTRFALFGGNEVARVAGWIRPLDIDERVTIPWLVCAAEFMPPSMVFRTDRPVKAASVDFSVQLLCSDPAAAMSPGEYVYGEMRSSISAEGFSVGPAAPSDLLGAAQQRSDGSHVIGASAHLAEHRGSPGRVLGVVGAQR